MHDKSGGSPRLRRLPRIREIVKHITVISIKQSINHYVGYPDYSQNFRTLRRCYIPFLLLFINPVCHGTCRNPFPKITLKLRAPSSWLALLNCTYCWTIQHLRPRIITLWAIRLARSEL